MPSLSLFIMDLALLSPRIPAAKRSQERLEKHDMTIYYARGSPEDVITPRDAKEALDVAFEKLGKRCGIREEGLGFAVQSGSDGYEQGRLFLTLWW